MIRAQRRTGLVFFPAFDWAISPIIPEREERLLYTQDQVMEEGLLDIPGIVEYRVRPAAYEDIQRTHFCVPNEASVTTESHLISAGGCLVAADAVLKGKWKAPSLWFVRRDTMPCAWFTVIADFAISTLKRS